MTVGLSDRLRQDSPRGPGCDWCRCSLCSSSAASLGLRINTSPSLPMGLYIITADAGANLVEFCPVEPFATLSIVRGYRDPGACRDGAAPLLKPVIARAGDVVEVSARGISVNGALLPNTAPLTKDTKGRPLEAWPSGRYVVDSRNRLGGLLLSSAQLRQPLFWPAFDCGHSPSAEGIPNAMNTRFRDRLSFCSAIAMGLGVSTGHPLGIVAAAGNAARVPHAGNAQGCFQKHAWLLCCRSLADGPRLGSLHRAVRDFSHPSCDLGPHRDPALGALDDCVDIRSSRHYLWRAPLALLATIVPPLGIIGLASPLTAAGYLFPGTAWVGLAAVALLPGIVLSTQALALRRRCAVLCLVSASALGLAIGGRLFTRGRCCASSLDGLR